MSTGGDIESVNLAGREFPVAGGTEVSRKLGGFENTSEPNGDGSARLIKQRRNWMLGGLSVSIDDSRGDHEFLQELADRADYFAVSATYSSGAIYQGRGQIEGELQANSQRTVADFDLSGPGRLTPQ